MNINPKISVVMSAYNRPQYVKEAIESILNQTYKDFEFIIIDDCSTDNTADIIQEYASKDDRIVFIRNKKNMDYNYNLRKGFEMARGEYIARMDDDDISMPARFEKQVKYMDEHPEITVLGTFIKTFGDCEALSWVTLSNSDELNIAMNFYNPMCHPSVMIRKSFLREHNLNYSPKELYAEEYHLWKEIILRGGKLANLPEELVKYRIHKKSVTQANKTGKIQDKTAERVREDLLNRFYNNKKEVKKIRKSIFKYPFEKNNKKIVSNVLEKMKQYPNIVSTDAINRFEEKFCGKPCTMDIFFASNDKFSQHLCVAMTSILKNALPIDCHKFYILDGGISDKNKTKIEKIKQVKNCEIEYIKVDNSLFDICPITSECQHISKQTYYRYIIPKLKPELEKCFYFDCDIIAKDTLNEFWNIDLEDNYAAVVEELWSEAHDYYKSNGIEKSFNAGIILINNKKWIEDNISEELFKNTKKLVENKKIRWVDQDVLNYTYNNKVKFVHPKYNLQQTAYFSGQHSLYTAGQMNEARYLPTIIHYSGHLKPWDKECWHPLWKEYYRFLKLTPYKNKYYKYKINKFLKNFGRIFYYKKKTYGKTKVKILGIPVYKKTNWDYTKKKYLFGIRFYKKKDNFSLINDKLKYLENIHQKIDTALFKIQDIEKYTGWQNYALSRLNYGQNTIFRYNSGLQLCNENFTYERVIAFDLDEAPIDHKERYKFALNYINANDAILDIACGTGYGTEALAKKANNATGIDIDEASINFANKIFKAPNLSYKCLDIFNANIDKKFDKIFSFETIEHIKEDVLFVQKLHSLLKDGGTLICSVPNETVFPHKKEENPFHVRHYTLKDFTKLLNENGFTSEDVYFQYEENEHKILKPTNNKEGYGIICIVKKGK